MKKIDTYSPHSSYKKKIKTIFIIVINIIPRLIIKLFPRDKKLIVYGGSCDKFIDNAKYQFIINNECLKEYRHVWVSKTPKLIDYLISKGYSTKNGGKISGIITVLRAGVIIYDDSISSFTNPLWSKGAVIINLWHGFPLKTIGGTNDHPYPNGWLDIVKKTVRGNGASYFLNTTKKISNLYSSRSSLPIDRIIIGGMPRTMCFFMKRNEIVDHISKYEDDDYMELYRSIEKNNCRKIIYMPTFREYNIRSIEKAIPSWSELNDTCAQYNTTIYLKLHRLVPLPSNFSYSHIILLDNYIDMYPLLSLFDLLVTDYSSIMIDFSLLQKPILLYIYDFDEYEKLRGFTSFAYELFKNVSIARNCNELNKFLFGNFDEIKKINPEDYYDSPKDFECVVRTIKKL